MEEIDWAHLQRNNLIHLQANQKVPHQAKAQIPLVDLPEVVEKGRSRNKETRKEEEDHTLHKRENLEKIEEEKKRRVADAEYYPLQINP